MAERDKRAKHLLRACPGSGHRHLHLLRHRAEEDRRIQWEDGEGNVIVIEHRAVYSKSEGIESPPTLETLIELGERMVDVLVAAWIARVWQEAIHTHPRNSAFGERKS